MTLSEKLGATNYFPRIYVEVRLISPKPAQVFVRRELQLFNTYGTVGLPSEFLQTWSYRPAVLLHHANDKLLMLDFNIFA